MTTHKLKTHSHELLVMSKLCDLYATLPLDRRIAVHEHLAGMITDLPVIMQVQPDGEPALLFHRNRERADAGQAAQ